MDVVVVPAWQRPDFLLATLRRLSIAADDDVFFHLCLDRGATRDVLRVADEFRGMFARDRVRVLKRRSHRFHGNSYNVLTGYAEACERQPTLVHLVEEDVFVAHDYFTFHRQAHALCPDAFAVTACLNHDVPHDPPALPDAIYTHDWYQSLGVSFRPVRLTPILQHATQPYFADSVRYCRSTFPDSVLKTGFTEQDGLIQRVRESCNGEVVYAAVPRAYHAGFTGYNRRGKSISGTVDQRAMQLLNMTSAELNAHALSYSDHQTTPLNEVRPGVTQLLDWPSTVSSTFRQGGEVVSRGPHKS